MVFKGRQGEWRDDGNFWAETGVRFTTDCVAIQQSLPSEGYSRVQRP